MTLSKTFLTNAISALLVFISFAFESHIGSLLLYTGLFALSGSVTNQLAIHMLFEKVPFLYGSGVIPLRFEAFKESIKNLMMTQFFTQEQIENFFESEEKRMDLAPVVEETDFSPAFDALSKTVMESSFGGMLGMFGGASILENLREPFTIKMKSAVIQIVESEKFNDTLQKHLKSSSLNDDMIDSIESIIDSRLGELTPLMVKEMVYKLINEHLSWLVVWGGVFGGLIGLVSAFLF
ncbi:MAG: DUF445 domain-containing protein [Sulfurimonas sp.]|uniref:DUF445 domain-containing protein n=1 Tax=Sulfurimonas sp. TaxID=2022749 RepID=UPI0026054FE4|nr:DUF445 domain-containing protein [Sulfurimonas sp.]MDD5372040.1 DUF445 domain-containing protein [Sulfurimonas sp.]